MTASETISITERNMRSVSLATARTRVDTLPPRSRSPALLRRCGRLNRPIRRDRLWGVTLWRQGRAGLCLHAARAFRRIGREISYARPARPKTTRRPRRAFTNLRGRPGTSGVPCLAQLRPLPWSSRAAPRDLNAARGRLPPAGGQQSRKLHRQRGPSIVNRRGRRTIGADAPALASAGASASGTGRSCG